MSQNRWILLLLLFVFRFELFSQTEVLFSHPGGFYDEPFVLSLGCTNLNCSIRYTTNGDMPTTRSIPYVAPLFLDESLYSTSDIYALPIAPAFASFVPDSVQHVIVIRAAAFDGEGERVSEVVTQTYLIRALGCYHHGLAVVSVCADSLSLFDYDTGILVPGVFFDPENPEYTGNYFQRGKEWERLANVEFYELDNTGINQQCGLRTHGNRARRAPAKGLKIYAREEYGKKRFKHRFFDTTSIKSFKHLILRPFSNLWPSSGVQDYVANRMALQMGLEAPNSRLVVLYLNGEYWGVYFLQEKLDDRYLEDHFGINPEECNIISNWGKEIESGDGLGFEQLMGWLETADLSVTENYDYLCSRIDVDDFVDYVVFETFIGNKDWPANNMRCWQEGDGKWRWFFYDGDAALIDDTFNVFDNASYMGVEGWPSSTKASLLFRRLFENNVFKQKFANRVEELCAFDFQYENTVPYLDEIKHAILPEIVHQSCRFGYPSSMEYWYWGVGLVDEFLRHRVDSYLNQYDNYIPSKPFDFQSNTNDFACFPSPTTDVVNIRMLDGRSRVVDFVLSDAAGRSLIRGVKYLHACETIVLGSELRSGVYVVKIGEYTHRFVKY